jgi:lysophospholipase L1-like esterase
MFERMRTKRIGPFLRIGLALACLAYGFYIADFRAARITPFGLALYALPLLFQLSKKPLVRAYALWFGVFMVAQGVFSPILLGDAANLYHHVPNLTRIVDAKVAEFTGGAGAQRVTTDELGFRAWPRVNYEEPAELRIFAIGGSTTEEFSINDEETWTHRVQTALTKDLSRHVEVINTGTSGAMSQHHIATLKYIESLHPNIALFLVGANDWNYDIHREFGSNVQRPRRTFPGTPLGRLARSTYYRVFEKVPNKVVKSDFITQGGSLKRERKITWFPEKASDRYLANLARLGSICRDTQLTCVFFTQPNGYQPGAPEAFKDLFWMSPPFASYSLTFDSLVRVAEVYNRALIDFGAKNGFPVCDLASRLEPSIELFTDELHFSFKGSERVAEAVTECLRPLLEKTHR